MHLELPYLVNIVGPESSGKTTLSKHLATSLGCPWVPEYAREYLEGLDRPYTLDDLNVIAEGQWERIKSAVKSEQVAVSSEEVKVKSDGSATSAPLSTRPLISQELIVKSDGSATSAPLSTSSLTNQEFIVMKSFLSSMGRTEDMDFSEGSLYPGYEETKGKNRFVVYQRDVFVPNQKPVVIIDSGMLALRMWARIKYGVSIPLVEEVLSKDVTSTYFLMRPLEEWEPDPLREAPSLLERSWIYNQYAAELAKMMVILR